MSREIIPYRVRPLFIPDSEIGVHTVISPYLNRRSHLCRNLEIQNDNPGTLSANYRH